ncbi:MAG: acyl-CoA reductase [Bacteroidia bacterium]|nr:acyl-CoA reductase [Bacteroidia bacterium]
MSTEKRIEAFAALGQLLNDYFISGKSNSPFLEKWKCKIDKIIEEQRQTNQWFTPENVTLALKSWSELLTVENLNKWLEPYHDLIQKKKNPVTVGVILAGNIPLVGMHDFVSVLISGNNFIGKLSSKDDSLIKLISSILCDIEPEFTSSISFSENQLTNFDAIIATGSNNTARYFEYYFGKYPSIIRRNRNSVAVLTGEETIEDLKNLSKDIFQYFGMGCRNVSKIYVPEKYNFDNFFLAMDHWNYLYQHNKYANNYDYHKSVYQMNMIEFFDNGFMLLKNDRQIFSPLSVIFYDYYSVITILAAEINENINEIQCIVSKSNEIENAVPFGKSQAPNLWDYADNIDTMKFLLKL